MLGSFVLVPRVDLWLDKSVLLCQMLALVRIQMLMVRQIRLQVRQMMIHC
jgi:hypothetical protein